MAPSPAPRLTPPLRRASCRRLAATRPPSPTLPTRTSARAPPHREGHLAPPRTTWLPSSCPRQVRAHPWLRCPFVPPSLRTPTPAPHQVSVPAGDPGSDRFLRAAWCLRAGAILDDMSRAFQVARGFRPPSEGVPAATEPGPVQPHHSHNLFNMALAPDPLSIMSPSSGRPPPQATAAVLSGGLRSEAGGAGPSTGEGCQQRAAGSAGRGECRTLGSVAAPSFFAESNC